MDMARFYLFSAPNFSLYNVNSNTLIFDIGGKGKVSTAFEHFWIRASGPESYS